MDRRAFLFSPLLVTGCRKPTLADSYVRGFPKSLPGVRLVQPHHVPGSAYVFVHVRQTHRTARAEAALLDPVQNGFDVDERAHATLVATEAVQNDIYTALKYACRQGLTRQVIREGMEGGSSELEKAWKDLDWTKNAYRKIQGQKRTSHNAEFLDQMELYLPLLEREITAAIGGHGRLVKEGVLTPIPEADERPEKHDPVFVKYIKLDAEYRTLRASCLQAHSKKSPAGAIRDLEERLRKKSDEIELLTNSREWSLMNERREDALLESCARKGAGVYWAVYGGGHDWVGNIDRRNTSHKQKFSLIVLTPQHYPQDPKAK